MDKLRMESPDMTAQNIDRIAALFPNCITEMLDDEHSTPEKKVYKRAVNFELLKQMLSPDVVDGDEAYEFTWVGKKAAIVEANKPIRKTLRPCVAESKDWNTTENLYIEGDNLEVLKLLQESYLGKVKMIYIDPPYNTGNDFIYADDFMRSQEEENEQMGMYDEDENRLFKNTDTNGRFHSDWCSMIYSRLMLARNLLNQTGCVFVSISDIEITNLRRICDEIFGSSNFVADLIWANKEGGGSSDSKLFRIKHEHILCYCKDINQISIIGVPISNANRYKGSDEYESTRGKYYLQKLGMGSIQYSISLDYPIEAPDGSFVMPADNNNGRKACWRWSQEKFNRNKERGFIEIKKDSSGLWTVYTKQYMNCDNEGNLIERTQRPMGIIDEYSSTQASKLLESMQLGSFFSYSKPVDLIKYLIARLDLADGIVLDFFSGSATTAHAVMQLNAEDGGHRKFIMVQLPEPCDEASEAYKAGYKNICEIGKERIRRAGMKIKDNLEQNGTDIQYLHKELKKAPTKNICGFDVPIIPARWSKADETEENRKLSESLDIGFRVLKLDDINMKDVYYAPDDYDQGMLAGLESNIKDDRTDLDLLFGCLIDWGLPLSLPYKSEKIDGCIVHTYNDGDLIACFDANIPESVVKEIAKRKPLRAVFRDSGFASSPEKINVFEIFKLYMPEDANDISKRVRVI